MRTVKSCSTVLVSALLLKLFWNFSKWMMQSTNQQKTVLIVSMSSTKITRKRTSKKFWTSFDEFIFNPEDKKVSDGVWCYSVNIIKCFMVLTDFKDAVSSGSGDYIAILRKQSLVHFFATPGFNEFAIEMLINILQCEVLQSKAKAHRCKWAATVNWKGGASKNIEIDLFQENRNAEMKKLIRSMGANKTEKAITRACQAAGGVSKIVEAFEEQVKMPYISTSHTHKSSVDDEKLISRDLRSLRPFKNEDGRTFETFVGISPDPNHLLDTKKFKEWIDRHKKNILMHCPVAYNEAKDESEDEELGEII